MRDVEICLDVLIEFCTILVEARQPVGAEVMEIVEIILEMVPFEQVGQKAATLRDML